MRQKFAEVHNQTANERRGSKRKSDKLSLTEFRKRVRSNHDSENPQRDSENRHRDMEMRTLASQRYHIFDLLNIVNLFRISQLDVDFENLLRKERN